MLRRRRRESGDQPGPFDDNHDAEQPAAADGPWDIADDYPEAERIDCGSLLIPVREGYDVQTSVAEEQGAGVAVVSGEGGMKVE